VEVRPVKGLTQTVQVTRTAVLAAVGIALFVLESFFPSPVPFLKIGLANVSSVIALSLLGPFPMFLVVIIRVVAGSALTGNLLSPAFLLALGGGLASAAMMAVVRMIARSKLSELGISLTGATAHVLAQLTLVRMLLVGSDAVYVLLPVLLLSSLAGGLIVGLIALHLVRSLRAAGVA
jgi:heptaprenyl diphosphate synthase